MADYSDYPVVENLAKAVKKYNIRFSVKAKSEPLSKIFYRRITMICSGKKFSIPVDDEYEDVKHGNPVVLLHLVLQECEFYEDAEDYLVWCKDVGLKAADVTVRSIYFELREIVPQIRALLGNLKAVPGYDIEFNTDVAQALRAVVIK